MNRLFGLILVLSGCVSCQHDRLVPSSVDSGFVLGEAALSSDLDKAQAGDGEAAFRLSLHYLSIRNYEERERWLLQAANGGHPGAQYTRWFDLRGRLDCASTQEALRWLQSSADAGHQRAREKLKEYKPLASECVP